MRKTTIASTIHLDSRIRIEEIFPSADLSTMHSCGCACGLVMLMPCTQNYNPPFDVCHFANAFYQSHLARLFVLFFIKFFQLFFPFSLCSNTFDNSLKLLLLNNNKFQNNSYKMSSFRRRLLRPYIKGTKTSPQTGQIVTSSGNPALDELLGGGVPMNSIILIEEDKHCIYSKVLCKYFLAEAVIQNQQLFLGCLDESPQEIMKKLPKPVFLDIFYNDPAPAEFEQLSMDTTGLRIAWRYNDLPYLNIENACGECDHQFNLLKRMDSGEVDKVAKLLWDGTEEEETSSCEDNTKDEENYGEDEVETSSTESQTTTFFTNKRFQSLIDSLARRLRFIEFCRICIPSLGSPLWYDENFGQDLLKFLTILRAMVQNTKCACFLTMPMHLIAQNEETLVPKIRNLVDYAIELESFAGSDRETNPAFKEYNGLLHFKKMSAINSLALVQHSDLAFKLRRKKFVIEKFHLPPELDDNTEQDSEAAISKSTTPNCASVGTPNELDF